MKTIKKGDSGFETKVAQALLNVAGSALKEDGSFGPATDAAVKSYQHKHALGQDGIIGPATWSRLHKP